MTECKHSTENANYIIAHLEKKIKKIQCKSKKYRANIEIIVLLCNWIERDERQKRVEFSSCGGLCQQLCQLDDVEIGCKQNRIIASQVFTNHTILKCFACSLLTIEGFYVSFFMGFPIQKSSQNNNTNTKVRKKKKEENCFMNLVVNTIISTLWCFDSVSLLLLRFINSFACLRFYCMSSVNCMVWNWCNVL